MSDPCDPCAEHACSAPASAGHNHACIRAAEQLTGSLAIRRAMAAAGGQPHHELLGSSAEGLYAAKTSAPGKCR